MFSRYFILLFVLGSVFYVAESVLKTTFLEDLCFSSKKSVIDLRYETSGILMSVPMRNYVEDFDCEVLLTPPRGKSVVLSILRYDVGTNDQLIIEDSDRHRIALLGWANFKDEKKSIVSDGKISIRYKVYNKTTYSSKAGFQFTFTKVGNAPCDRDEFQCKNDKCLSTEYVCDGHNHCGDRSEQAKCNFKVTKSHVEREQYKGNNFAPLLISVIIVASVALFIIIVVFIVVMVRRSNAKKVVEEQNAPSSHRGGDLPLQSPTVPAIQQLPTTVNNSEQASNSEQSSVYNRVLQSFRGPKVEQIQHQQASSEAYQVPSMYPSMDQLPSAPAMYGIVNPEFQTEE